MFNLQASGCYLKCFTLSGTMAKKPGTSDKGGSRKKPKAQVAPYSIAVGLKKGFPVTKKTLKPRPASTKGVSSNHILCIPGLGSRESRPELESVGVDRFIWSQSWSVSNFADSNSGLESHDTTH